MTMNKQGEVGIRWTNFTWNCISGCNGGCSYCYARAAYKRFGRSFKPTFHPEKLNEPMNQPKPSKIFVCSVSDIFGDFVMPEWQQSIFRVMDKCTWHTFQLLTKCPQNIDDCMSFPKQVWLGVTVTGPADLWRIDTLRKKNAQIRFVSFEPLLEEISDVNLAGIDWIIIGGKSGNPERIPPAKEVEKLTVAARKYGSKIFLKSNLHYVFTIEEFPE